MSSQRMDTFDNSCDVPCLTSKLPCDKTTSYLRNIHFLREERNFDLVVAGLLVCGVAAVELMLHYFRV